MTKKQPFLPGFPTTICGSIRRRLQDVIAARRKSLTGASIASYALQFSGILPVEFLDEHSGTRRKRHYCNTNIFWAWLAQILEANSSCSKAVSLVQAWCADAGLPAPAADTGAYCKARKRVEIVFLRAIRRRVTSHLQNHVRAEDKYEGLVVKSIDGSSVQLEDTAENQSSYPQPATQKAGCGFPVMGIMGVLNHSHGGWEDFAICTEAAHDAPVAHKLLHCFGEGDLACADRAFCNYDFIALLRTGGAHSLMRLHQSRHGVLDFRRGKKLGKNQRLVTWPKPKKKPAKNPLTEAQWEALPATMEIRLIRFEFHDRDGKKRRMVLATTLLDAERYDWEDLATIYAQRWDIELRLRDVKTTLGMERFKVKTPAMAHKTLEMMITGYNLVKVASQEAAHEAGENLRLMSFKGCLDTIVAHTIRYRGRQRQPNKIQEIWGGMIEIVSTKLINLRPGRHEPRAIKKRPKSYSFLTCPRAEYKEVPHKGKRRSYA
jgi:hypothetical protein